MESFMPTRKPTFLREFFPLFADDVPVKRVFPFMVVKADSSVVNGHNGIWQPELS